MVICCSLPVPRSFAETFTMPLASISKVTSICGTPRRAGGDAVQMEAAEALVVLRHLALALQDVDLNGGLVVRGGGEHLALAGRDGGVAVDELGADAAERLDAERQRGHVEQQNAFDVAAEHAALNGSAHGHALIGVDALEGVFAGEALNGFLHGGDTGGAADEQHLAQIVHGEAGVAQRLTDRGHRALNEMMGQLVELRAGQRHVEMLRAVRVGGDIRQVDVGARHAGQIALRFFGGLAQTLHGDLIAGEVNALGLLELLNEVIGHALIKSRRRRDGCRPRWPELR